MSSKHVSMEHLVAQLLDKYPVYEQQHLFHSSPAFCCLSSRGTSLFCSLAQQGSDAQKNKKSLYCIKHPPYLNVWTRCTMAVSSWWMLSEVLWFLRLFDQSELWWMRLYITVNVTHPVWKVPSSDGTADYLKVSCSVSGYPWVQQLCIDWVAEWMEWES